MLTTANPPSLPLGIKWHPIIIPMTGHKQRVIILRLIDPKSVFSPALGVWCTSEVSGVSGCRCELISCFIISLYSSRRGSNVLIRWCHPPLKNNVYCYYDTCDVIGFFFHEILPFVGGLTDIVICAAKSKAHCWDLTTQHNFQTSAVNWEFI